MKKRATLKEIRARAAENALCLAEKVLSDKWLPLAWANRSANRDSVERALWECMEEINKMRFEQAKIRRELEDKRR